MLLGLLVAMRECCYRCWRPWFHSLATLSSREEFTLILAYRIGTGSCGGGVFIVVVLLLSRLKIAHLHEKEISQVKTDMLFLVGHLNVAMSSKLDLQSAGKHLL